MVSLVVSSPELELYVGSAASVQTSLEHIVSCSERQHDHHHVVALGTDSAADMYELIHTLYMNKELLDVSSTNILPEIGHFLCKFTKELFTDRIEVVSKIHLWIHCVVGSSRSVALVTGLLCAMTPYSYSTIHQALCTLHHASSPNPGFNQQLNLFKDMISHDSLSTHYRKDIARLNLLSLACAIESGNEFPPQHWLGYDWCKDAVAPWALDPIEARIKLSQAVSHYLNENIRTTNIEANAIHSQTNATRNKLREYSCAKCRLMLFNEASILDTIDTDDLLKKMYTEPFPWVMHQVSDPTGVSVSPSSHAETVQYDYDILPKKLKQIFFIVEALWLRAQQWSASLKTAQGIIRCPKCHHKLGRFSFCISKMTRLPSGRLPMFEFCSTYVVPHRPND